MFPDLAESQKRHTSSRCLFPKAEDTIPQQGFFPMENLNPNGNTQQKIQSCSIGFRKIPNKTPHRGQRGHRGPTFAQGAQRSAIRRSSPKGRAPPPWASRQSLGENMAPAIHFYVIFVFQLTLFFLVFFFNISHVYIYIYIDIYIQQLKNIWRELPDCDMRPPQFNNALPKCPHKGRACEPAPQPWASPF